MKWDDNSKIQAKNAQLILLPKLPSHVPAQPELYISLVIHSITEDFDSDTVNSNKIRKTQNAAANTNSISD